MCRPVMMVEKMRLYSVGYGALGIRTEGPDHRRVGRKFGEIFLETRSEGSEEGTRLCKMGRKTMDMWSGAEAVSVCFV